jgi:DNA-binding transcriptional LysR family regulator
VSQYDRGPDIRDILLAKVPSHEDQPKIVHHNVSRESINSLVGAGFGLTLTTEASIGANFSGAIYREARDGAGPVRIGYSAHWRRDNGNPALASFLNLLGERYPLPVTGALTCATRLGEGAISRNEAR